MTDELVAILCGRVFNKTHRLPPISFEIVSDIRDVRIIIQKYPPLTRFIILYYDQLDQVSGEILCPLSCEENIDVIVLGGNSLNNLPQNQINRLRLSDDLAAYKTVFCGIHAYQLIAKRYYASNNKDFGAFFDDEARKLLSWLINNFRLKACHILIIPLNTTYENIMNCQLELIEKCQSMWPNKEIRVCTIDDYHLAEESFNTEDSSDDISGPFTRHDRDMMLTLIRHLAPIRLYLVGNERQISNNYSRLLVAKERYISENNVDKYMDGCTFLEKELVGAGINGDLPGFLGTKWQMDGSQIKLRSLDELFVDNLFQNTVNRVDDTMSNRDKDARIALWKRNNDYQENNADYSTRLHRIGQAQSVPGGEGDSDDERINASGQLDFFEPF